MRHRPSSWVLFVLFSAIIESSLSSDPVQQLVRSVALDLRILGERILARIPIPNLDSSPISFQNDPNGVVVDTLTNLLDMCPVCLDIEKTPFFGTWHVIFWNRNFLLNTVSDIVQLIDKLVKNAPVSNGKSFAELFESPPVVICPQITFLDASDSTRLEVSLNADGEAKSIVGKMRRAEDNSLVWKIGPSLSTSMCVTYTNMMQSPAESDVLILAQIDSIPKCENFLVLAKNHSLQSNVAIVDYLERQRANSGLNPMLEVSCPRQ
ncbi:hypothetical protein L596_011274 [Steinernema carpocapsae]|uniref:Uncharacterized protein n=1 Tax=Steinernema carpocapsae TaxID=34508 RepID=A0A4U5NTC6_STECR|nr:hypothetical protein L596_011274 [Steinernema carpocapsae]